MHWVEKFMESHVKLDPDIIPFILVACDPNGGGDSQMALVSVAFCRGQLVVVGLDSHAVRGHDQIQMLLLEHIKELRKIWKTSWIIFVAESNLGQEADHMKHMLRDHGFVYCVCEDGLAGVRTTNKRKELYAMELCKFMSQDGCAFNDKLVVANPFNGGDKQLETLDSFKKQLVGFRKIILTSNSGRSEPKVCYTGKSQGAQDDLCITLTIAAYWGVQFLTQHIPGVPYEMFKST